MSSSSSAKQQPPVSGSKKAKPTSQAEKPQESSNSVLASPAARIVLSCRSTTLSKSQVQNNQLFQIFIGKKLLGKSLSVKESFELLLLGKKEVFTVEEVGVSGSKPTNTQVSTAGGESGGAASPTYLVTDATTFTVLLSETVSQPTMSSVGDLPAFLETLVEELHRDELAFLESFVTQATDPLEQPQYKFTRLLVCAPPHSGKSTLLQRLSLRIRQLYQLAVVDLEDAGVLSVRKCSPPAALFLRKIVNVQRRRIDQVQSSDH